MNNADGAVSRGEQRLNTKPATAGHAGHRRGSSGKTGCRPLLRTVPDLRLGEDTGYYIPDLLADGRYEVDPRAFAAATDYARQLHQAEGLLHDARNLVSLLRSSLETAVDERAAQAESALKVIERKLGDALARINRHDARYTNLFLAYADLKARADRSQR